MKTYNITCKDCGAVRQIGIVTGGTTEMVDWLDNNPDPQEVKIVSARKRFDDKWGFQCICGNNDMWTEQESRFVKNKVSPKPQEIVDIIKNIKPAECKFEMVVA